MSFCVSKADVSMITFAMGNILCRSAITLRCVSIFFLTDGASQPSGLLLLSKCAFLCLVLRLLLALRISLLVDRFFTKLDFARIEFFLFRSRRKTDGLRPCVYSQGDILVLSPALYKSRMVNGHLLSTFALPSFSILRTLPCRMVGMRRCPSLFITYTIGHRSFHKILHALRCKPARAVVMLPSPILSAGFHMQHWAYLPELFNHMPQSVELGSTFHGAYIFSGNVVLENT